jgi:threonine synthase
VRDADREKGAYFLITTVARGKACHEKTRKNSLQCLTGAVVRRSFVPSEEAMQNQSNPAVLALIGNTPLIEVTRLDTGPCQLFLKLESQNPGGSIKDRIGLSMIEAAETDGRL